MKTSLSPAKQLQLLLLKKKKTQKQQKNTKNIVFQREIINDVEDWCPEVSGKLITEMYDKLQNLI